MISQRFSLGPTGSEIATLQSGEIGNPPALVLRAVREFSA
ncbi:hypothetical protein ABIC09_000708 [Bradyrhizobium sp. S3.12.5]